MINITFPKGLAGKCVQVEVLTGKDKGNYFESCELITDDEWHPSILEGLLKRLQLSYKTFLFRGVRILESEGDSYKMVGAGDVDMVDDRIICDGMSSAYNIEINEEHLRRMLPDFRKAGLRVFLGNSFSSKTTWRELKPIGEK